MLRPVQLTVGLLLLIIIEVLKVYFIMPFPGSQRAQTIEIAYFLHNNIFYLRIIGWLIILFPVLYYFTLEKVWPRVIVGLGLIVYLFVFYMFNYRFLADKMFYQPKHKNFAESSNSIIPTDNLVLGVSVKDESKAYPIELIGYHHQVRDTVGNTPVMVTYCTVCRTGRVFSPVVNGRPEQFRLVGMDHFNAMFEDATTGSWWRQVNGEAVAGPLRGYTLPEIFAEQMTLKSWLEIHPASKIMQPDSTYKSEYESLEGFDEGTIKSGLENRDSLSWKEKSWVVGIQIGMQARAYDWNDLIREKVINDTLAGVPIVLAVESDSASFHAWKRDSIDFEWDEQQARLKDKQTQSLWNWQGTGVSGPLQGEHMLSVQAYQEFWHSWRTFRPQTSKYSPGNGSI